MRAFVLVLLLGFGCFGLSRPASADERKLLLTQVEMYLQRLTTLKADFVQIAPGGDLVSGIFYLKRPGKMRWEYDPPVPVVMAGNGKFLRYWDRELDQISDIPLDDTLAGFLAKDTISFADKAIKVLDTSSENKVLRVKIEMADKPEDGNLTMEFEESPLKLRNLILVDAEGKQTNVSLNNATYGISLPDNLFVIKDTRLRKEKRR